MKKNWKFVAIAVMVPVIFIASQNFATASQPYNLGGVSPGITVFGPFHIDDGYKLTFKFRLNRMRSFVHVRAVTGGIADIRVCLTDQYGYTRCARGDDPVVTIDNYHLNSYNFEVKVEVYSVGWGFNIDKLWLKIKAGYDPLPP